MVEIKLKINGKDESFEGKTIMDIIEKKKLNAEHVVVEHNMKIIPKKEWNDTEVNQDDNVEIVSFVGGG